MTKKETLKEFARILRETKLPQSRSYLKNRDGYCCLGVFAEAKGGIFKRSGCRYVLMPNCDTQFLGSDYNIRADLQSVLSDLNDYYKMSFEEIADFIERVIIPNYTKSNEWFVKYVTNNIRVQ